MSHLSLVKFYKRYEDRHGRHWFVPTDTRFPADDVWMWNPNNQNGLNGTIRQFVLGPGSSVTVKGPWLSNAEHLYKETGVDVRDRSAVKMKVFRKLTKQLLYQDHDWVVGSIDSCRDNAQHISNHNSTDVIAEIETAGGGITYTLYPTKLTEGFEGSGA